MFRFLVEEKIKCLATEKVKYTQRVDYIMQLPVPMDAALNKGEQAAIPERPQCTGPWGGACVSHGFGGAWAPELAEWGEEDPAGDVLGRGAHGV